MESFSEFVIEKLESYVYLLIDPRNNEEFYVGKGIGNRVFAHANDSLSEPLAEEEPNLKLDRIREIRSQGKDGEHVILRHGLTEKEALEIEATILDFTKYLRLASLTNQVSGFWSDDRGLMSVKDIIIKYEAKPAAISEPVLLITVNRLYQNEMSPEKLYEITRGNWVIGARREKAKYGFTVYKGIIREVYTIHNWEEIFTDNFNHKILKLWRFNGEVNEEMSLEYTNQSTIS
jgi:hypothetical protein